MDHLTSPLLDAKEMHHTCAKAITPKPRRLPTLGAPNDCEQSRATVKQLTSGPTTCHNPTPTNLPASEQRHKLSLGSNGRHGNGSNLQKTRLTPDVKLTGVLGMKAPQKRQKVVTRQSRLHTSVSPTVTLNDDLDNQEIHNNATKVCPQ